MRARKVLPDALGYRTFVVDADTGNVFEVDLWSGASRQVGGSGADFAINELRLYGVTPDRTQVWGYDDRWTELDRPPHRVRAIYAGGRLLLCYLDNGEIVLAAHGYPWRRISDRPARSLAVKVGPPFSRLDVVYALRDDLSVEEWIPEGGDLSSGRGRWERVRGAGTTRRIVTGGSLVGDPARPQIDYLWAADATADQRLYSPTGDIHVRREGVWRKVGGPGAAFAANRSYLYGLHPDRQAIFKYTGTPDLWDPVGAPPELVEGLYGGAWSDLFAITSSKAVFQLTERA